MKKYLSNKIALLVNTFEIKKSIKKNTLFGFIMTISFILISSLVFFFEVHDVKSDTFEVKPTSIDIGINFPAIIEKKIEKQKQPVKNKSKKLAIGKDKISGDYKAVEDNRMTDNSDKIADINEVAYSFSETGDNYFPQLDDGIKFSFENKKKNIEKIKIEEEKFIEAEIYPSCDMKKLMKNIKYPELARKIGIQGKVILKIVVEKDGSISKVEIISSDNEIFNEPSIDAVSNIKFNPAIQNGLKIKCPVIIPIEYKLK